MIVLADSDPGFTARVAEQLGRRGDLLAVEALPELDRLLANGAGQPTVVVLGPHVPTEQALAVAERMQLSSPEVSVVVVADSLSSDLLQSALRAGARDVLPSSFTDDQLLDAVERAEALARQMRGRVGGADGGGGDGSDHRVITVFSSKGGVGKSFVASNLAVLLAQTHFTEVALVDLDLQFGDLAIMLQTFPARTMYDASANVERLDGTALRSYLTPHRSGVHLLAAPLEPGLAETISGEAVQRIVRMLRETYRFVVVDTPAALNDIVLPALDESDACALVTSLEVPAIKNAKLALQTLELLGVSRERIVLALNRADSEVGLRVHEVERTLGTPVDVQVPSGREVPLSINQGQPLAVSDPGSPVVAALARLAEAVAGAPAAGAAPAETAKRGRFRIRRRER